MLRILPREQQRFADANADQRIEPRRPVDVGPADMLDSRTTLSMARCNDLNGLRDERAPR